MTLPLNPYLINACGNPGADDPGSAGAGSSGAGKKRQQTHTTHPTLPTLLPSAYSSATQSGGPTLVTPDSHEHV